MHIYYKHSKTFVSVNVTIYQDLSRIVSSDASLDISSFVQHISFTADLLIFHSLSQGLLLFVSICQAWNLTLIRMHDAYQFKLRNSSLSTNVDLLRLSMLTLLISFNSEIVIFCLFLYGA